MRHLVVEGMRNDATTIHNALNDEEQQLFEHDWVIRVLECVFAHRTHVVLHNMRLSLQNPHIRKAEIYAVEEAATEAVRHATAMSWSNTSAVAASQALRARSHWRLLYWHAKYTNVFKESLAVITAIPGAGHREYEARMNNWQRCTSLQM